MSLFIIIDWYVNISCVYFVDIMAKERNVKASLFKELSCEDVHCPSKVTVVGVGQVGMAIAYSLLLKVMNK